MRAETEPGASLLTTVVIFVALMAPTLWLAVLDRLLRRIR
jgi:hypothetical protein